MKKASIRDILACPDCSVPVAERPYDTYACTRERGSVYNKSDGLPNLLPIRLKGNDERYESKSRGIEVGEFKLDEKNTQCLIGDISIGAGREILDHISKLIQKGLPEKCYNPDGTITKEGVFGVTGLFEEMLRRYRGRVTAEVFAMMTGAANQARYEAELQATGDYGGNFIIPNEIINSLPSKGNVVELAMGNGANLRRLQEKGDFERIIGLDYSFGMVRAAKRHNGNGNTLLAMGDAHHIPIVEDAIDLLMMFNALDRLRDPRSALRRMRRVMRDESTIVLGQCMPFQYMIEMSDGTIIDSLPEEKRIENLEEAVSLIPDARIKSKHSGLDWFPETVTQGKEHLKVDLIVAKIS